jgi:hypothetical protein
MRNILSSLPRLRTLDLSRCSLSLDTLQAIFQTAFPDDSPRGTQKRELSIACNLMLSPPLQMFERIMQKVDSLCLSHCGILKMKKDLLQMWERFHPKSTKSEKGIIIE